VASSVRNDTSAGQPGGVGSDCGKLAKWVKDSLPDGRARMFSVPRRGIGSGRVTSTHSAGSLRKVSVSGIACRSKANPLRRPVMRGKPVGCRRVWPPSNKGLTAVK
jgi:hypothetical protein